MCSSDLITIADGGNSVTIQRDLKQCAEIAAMDEDIGVQIENAIIVFMHGNREGKAVIDAFGASFIQIQTSECVLRFQLAQSDIHMCKGGRHHAIRGRADHDIKLCFPALVVQLFGCETGEWKVVFINAKDSRMSCGGRS